MPFDGSAGNRQPAHERDDEGNEADGEKDLRGRVGHRGVLLGLAGSEGKPRCEDDGRDNDGGETGSVHDGLTFVGCLITVRSGRCRRIGGCSDLWAQGFP